MADLPLKIKESAAVVIGVIGDDVQVFSDFSDLQLLKVLKASLDFIQGITIGEKSPHPQVVVITILFDVDGKAFLTANVGWQKVKLLLASLVKGLLDKTTVVSNQEKGTGLQNVARIYKKKP